jgi:hypothetical protein
MYYLCYVITTEYEHGHTIGKVWGGGGVSKPTPSEIARADQNRAKLNPIVKTVKIAEFRTPTPQDVRGKKAIKFYDYLVSRLFFISNDK